MTAPEGIGALPCNIIMVADRWLTMLAVPGRKGWECAGWVDEDGEWYASVDEFKSANHIHEVVKE